MAIKQFNLAALLDFPNVIGPNESNPDEILVKLVIFGVRSLDAQKVFGPNGTTFWLLQNLVSTVAALPGGLVSTVLQKQRPSEQNGVRYCH